MKKYKLIDANNNKKGDENNFENDIYKKVENNINNK